MYSCFSLETCESKQEVHTIQSQYLQPARPGLIDHILSATTPLERLQIPEAVNPDYFLYRSKVVPWTLEKWKIDGGRGRRTRRCSLEDDMASVSFILN